MAECFLQIGVDESLDGDFWPSVFPMKSLIPDTHEHLFKFLDFDLYQLEEPLAQYLSVLDDENVQLDKKLRSSIVATLRELHPFFRLNLGNIQSYLNSIFVEYIRFTFPQADLDTQRALFSKVSIKRYSTGSDPVEMIPEKYPSSPHRVVEDLFKLQDRMRRITFITLDNSNPGLAELPMTRRAALYSLAYSADPLVCVNADFGIAPSNKMKKYILQTEFDRLPDLEEQKKPKAPKKPDEENPYEKNLNKLRNALDELYWKPDNPISPALREVMIATKDVVDPITITYTTETLPALLDLEVYRMITEDIRIHRCMNCTRYFVQDRVGQEYCSVCKKPAPKIKADEAPVATPKLTADQRPSYQPYRRRYKTLKARVDKATMTPEEFDEWNKQALEKSALVDKGKMPLDEFEKWLKS